MGVQYPRKEQFTPMPFEVQFQQLFDKVWKETPELTWKREDTMVYRVKSSSKLRIVVDCAKQDSMILPRPVFVEGFIQHQCDSIWIMDSRAGNILEANPELLQNYAMEFMEYELTTEQDIDGPDLTFYLSSITLLVNSFYYYDFLHKIVAHIKAIWSFHRETRDLQQVFPFEHLLIDPDRTNFAKLYTVVDQLTYNNATPENGFVIKLDLSNRDFSGGIPPIVFEFRHLQELVLNNCLLTTLPQTLAHLAPKTISLIGNRFTVPPPILTRIPTLTSIRISSDRWLPEYKPIQLWRDLSSLDEKWFDCYWELSQLAEKDLPASKRFEHVLAIYEPFIQRIGLTEEPTPLKLELWKLFADHLFEEKRYAEAGAAYAALVNWLFQKGSYPVQVQAVFLPGKNHPREDERISLLRRGIIPQPALEEPEKQLVNESEALEGFKEIFYDLQEGKNTGRETSQGYYIQENGHVTALFLKGPYMLHKRDINKFLTCLATFHELEVFHFLGQALVLSIPLRHLPKLKRIEIILHENVRLEFLGTSSSVETLKITGESFYQPLFSIANCQELKSLSIETKTQTLLPDLRSLHKLTSYNLVGPYAALPEGLTDLPALEQLTCITNTDSLPDSFGKLKTLKSLKIQGSGLQFLPSSIRDCTELTEISVTSCALKDLPAEICHLSKLRKLDLTNNHLTQLPENFGQLTALEELLLAKNKLDSLPASIEQITGLKIIDLEHNRFQQIPPMLRKVSGIVKLANNPIKEGLAEFLNQVIPVPATLLSTILSKFGYIEPLSAQYLATWGFDPARDLQLVGGSSFKYEARFPLTQDAALVAAGVELRARVEIDTKGVIHNRIVFVAKDGKEEAIRCSHTAIYAQKTSNTDPASERTPSYEICTTEKHPEVLPPWDHFAALKSFVGALADCGIGMLTCAGLDVELQPTGSGEGGLNSNMREQIFKILDALGEDLLQKTLEEIVLCLLENSPPESLLVDLYNRDPLEIVAKNPAWLAPGAGDEKRIKYSQALILQGTNELNKQSSQSLRSQESNNQNFQSAESLFRRATEVDPSNISAWINLGMANLWLKKVNEAALAYARAVQIDGNAWMAWTFLGVSRFLLAQYPDAANACERALTSKVDSFTPLFFLGCTCAKVGNLDKARDAFTRAMAVCPEKRDFDQLDTQLDLNALIREHSKVLWAVAGENSKKIIMDAWNSYRNRLTEKPEDAQAVTTALEHALELWPENINDWIRLGNARMILNRYTDAAEAYIKVTMLNPKNALAWGGLAAAQFCAGNSADAAKASMRATELAPKIQGAWVTLAVANYRLGNVVGLKNACIQAMIIDPNMYDTKNIVLFDPQKTIETLEEAYHKLPSVLLLRGLLRNLSIKMRNFSRAITIAEEISILDPTQGDDWCELGSTAYIANDLYLAVIGLWKVPISHPSELVAAQMVDLRSRKLSQNQFDPPLSLSHRFFEEQRDIILVQQGFSEDRREQFLRDHNFDIRSALRPNKTYTFMYEAKFPIRAPLSLHKAGFELVSRTEYVQEGSPTYLILSTGEKEIQLVKETSGTGPLWEKFAQMRSNAAALAECDLISCWTRGYLHFKGDTPIPAFLIENSWVPQQSVRDILDPLSLIRDLIENSPNLKKPIIRELFLCLGNLSPWVILPDNFIIELNRVTRSISITNLLEYYPRFFTVLSHPTLVQWVSKECEGKLSFLKSERHWEEIIFLSENAIKLQPNNAAFWKFLSWGKHHLDDMAGAIAAAKRGLENDPQDLQLWDHLSDCQTRSRDFKGAVESANKLIELDPKNTNGWFHLAFAKTEIKDYLGGIAGYERAIQLNAGKSSREKQGLAIYWNNLGYIYLQLKEPRKAREAYDNALKLDPQDDYALRSLSICLTRMADFDGALAAGEQAIKIVPNNALIWSNLAPVKSRLGDYSGYFNACAKALELDPTTANAWINIGQFWSQFKWLPAALRATNLAIAIDPENDGAWANLVHFNVESGDVTGALKACIRMVQIQPETPQCWTALASIRLVTNDLQWAVSAILHAIRLDPYRSESWAMLGGIRCKQKMHSSAIRAIQRSLFLDTFDFQVWELLARAYELLGRGEEATHAREQAQHWKATADLEQANPDHARAWTLFATAYNKLNNFQEGLEASKHALSIDAKYVPAWLNLGTAQHGLKNLTGAIDAITSAIQLDEKNADLWEKLGSYQVEDKRFADAITSLEKALALHPADPTCLSRLGMAYLAVGNEAKGKDTLEKAVEKSNMDAITWLNLAQVRNQMSDFTGASSASENVIIRTPKNPYAWRSLSFAARGLDDIVGAIGAAEQALELCVERKDSEMIASLHFDLARYQALAGDLAVSLEHLREAINLDTKWVEKARAERDFEILRDNPAFRSLVGESGRTTLSD